MADRPLSEREREILSFLLAAPAIPDGDVFRRQAAVAVSSGSDCPCGCASIGLVVDPSAAPQARFDLPGNLVEASTVDVAGVHKREPLQFFGDDGRFGEAVQPTDDDLVGGIGLILWVEGGWLSGIEIWGAGNFAHPRTFPPAELFEAPRVSESR
jgi:hypothetical protein